MINCKKIISSALATAVVLSSLTLNAFAAQSNRTYTVIADKTEGLAAGDTITVEIKIDKTENLFNAGYELYFDPEAFSIDTAAGGMGKPKKYVDVAWNKEITDTSGDTYPWGYFLGSPTRSESATDGYIKYGWGGNVDAGSGILSEYNQENYTIGKFYFKVKDSAKGKYTFTISGDTFGYNENTADIMTHVPLTVTVGSSTVAVTGVSIKDKADFTLDLNGETTKTLEAVVAPADATNKAVKWSSDNEKAATVVDGKVTAVGEGKAIITVTTVDGGFTDSVLVTVKDTTPPEKPIVDVTPSKITGDYGTKTLKYIAKIVKNADATSYIKVTKTLGENTESKTTTQTIAELLGGVANDGALITADVAIGVLTADTDAVFSFGLVK